MTRASSPRSARTSGLDAGQPQPAPQRLLPGLRQGPVPLRLVDYEARAGCGPGWALGARHAARTRSSTTAIVSDGRINPVDSAYKYGRHFDAAWAAARHRNATWSVSSSTRAIRDASVAVAERRVRQLRAVSGHPRPAERRRPHRPHHGSFERNVLQGRHRDAGRAWLQAVQVRHGRTARLAYHRQPVSPETSTACTPMRTGRSSGALPAY